MQQQQPGTVTHSRISSLLISRRLTRPRDIHLHDWKWAWQPPNFRLCFARQWLNPTF